jgi:hypothetical protein
LRKQILLNYTKNEKEHRPALHPAFPSPLAGGRTNVIVAPGEKTTANTNLCVSSPPDVLLAKS